MEVYYLRQKDINKQNGTFSSTSPLQSKDVDVAANPGSRSGCPLAARRQPLTTTSHRQNNNYHQNVALEVSEASSIHQRIQADD
jgi:hypothetical protein